MSAQSAYRTLLILTGLGLLLAAVPALRGRGLSLIPVVLGHMSMRRLLTGGQHPTVQRYALLHIACCALAIGVQGGLWLGLLAGAGLLIAEYRWARVRPAQAWRADRTGL